MVVPFLDDDFKKTIQLEQMVKLINPTTKNGQKPDFQEYLRYVFHGYSTNPPPGPRTPPPPEIAGLMIRAY